ncbi:hypothetical protein QBC36DRAFT_299686 [Triangularia setosa]|uniref:Uncharacterized protein n=1 Tax=Triangularia setosa TaxID=2587417 RepID=A0AAN6WA47_9PEZI|nr:hypothetical protein QBC36DRAFT_299686 [Podospora setosa]
MNASGSESSKNRGGRKGTDPNDLIEAALQDGLTEDKSEIDGDPVRKTLSDTTEPRYDEMMKIWEAYAAKFEVSGPFDMRAMKHFTETVARSTKCRLDKSLGRPTVRSIRVKMQRFMSQWQRATNTSIPAIVRESVCYYIQDVFRYKIPLWVEEKAPKYLTIENYTAMEEHLWLIDHHNYMHEGSRVDESTLLKLHAYTGARLREICNAKYKDLLCMVAWQDGEPEIKIGFKRDLAKGMQDTPKKPKHPLYERLKPTRPLFANRLLFLLAIIISAGTFKNYKTIDDVLDARPNPRSNFRIMEWRDEVLDDLVFPEMSVNGPTKKIKNATAWGAQCSAWGSIDGCKKSVLRIGNWRLAAQKGSNALI